MADQVTATEKIHQINELSTLETVDSIINDEVPKATEN